MKLSPLFIIACTALLLSCEKKGKIEPSPDSVAKQAAEVKQDSTPIAQQEVATQKVKEVVNISSAPKGALNPAHGEPNHRCDIAVGAPLDSAPQNAAQQNLAPQVLPAQQSQPNFNTKPTNTADNGQKPALNPPHGEPHHRCDLQVGAPLT